VLHNPVLRGAAPYALAGILIIGTWVWGYMARGAVEGQRAAAVAAAMQEAAEERLAASLAQQQALHAAQLEAAEKRARARQQATRVVDDIVEEIRNEPTSVDCLNSAAVLHALVRLRTLEAARADSDD
jgi:hypothetical protein